MELERVLIARIEDFLRAMGSMFAFMGSQYRLVVEYALHDARNPPISLPSRVMGWGIFALREREAHLFRNSRYSIPK
jgi:hypothetical protein